MSATKSTAAHFVRIWSVISIKSILTWCKWNTRHNINYNKQSFRWDREWQQKKQIKRRKRNHNTERTCVNVIIYSKHTANVNMTSLCKINVFFFWIYERSGSFSSNTRLNTYNLRESAYIRLFEYWNTRSSLHLYCVGSLCAAVFSFTHAHCE